eukprot:TRINITY_DN25372_c0_g1_i1.p1 TRINITY_DN25372_c0_g1~~TRINITY_DN25372_c0_g1_i1.p1  ORF type:complete len:1785 (-),score=227.56 TRINITY_DN25372_c0_g1_i1:66-4634(-)
MSAGQFANFFRQYIGEIIHAEGVSSPTCLPVRLAELCVMENRREAAVLGDACKSCGCTPQRHQHATNLYAVNKFVIVPETAHLCISYAESVNPQGMTVNFFISHHWGEDFGEFTQSLIRHAMSNLSNPRVFTSDPARGRWEDWVYWCCAFANNQHVVELGDTLSESPFYLALSSKGCRGTVMMLNQQASALDRVWCIYEVYLTHKLGKDFVLNSLEGPLDEAAGMSAAKDIWLMHFFRLLQNIDVAQADATRREDFDKIMYEIRSCEFREHDGLVERGPSALNTFVKRILAQEVIFSLARRGEAQLVKAALMLKANPNEADARGIRPLTYAHGGGHMESTSALLQARADPMGMDGATHVVQVWSSDEVLRQSSIDALLQLSDEARNFHSAAISKARQGIQNALAAHLTVFLYPAMQPNAGLRLEAVRELGKRIKKLQESGADEDVYLGHMRKLAPCLTDPDTRVRKATVESFNSMFEVDLDKLLVEPVSMPVDALGLICEVETTRNVVQLAACGNVAIALHILIASVDWTLEFNQQALIQPDSSGQTVVHHTVCGGHAKCLRNLAEKCNLPTSLFRTRDCSGWLPIHHAAARGSTEALYVLCSCGDFVSDDLATRAADGRMAVHVAAELGHGDFLKALVKCGISPQHLAEADEAGSNVLHIASATNQYDLVRTLIVDCSLPGSALVDGDGWHRTPAHVAAAADAKEVLQVMLELDVPTHLPMGPQTPARGSVALVRQIPGERRKTLGMGFSSMGSGIRRRTVADTPTSTPSSRHSSDEWRVGKIVVIDRNGIMTMDYSDRAGLSLGTDSRESNVTVDRCIFGPTPLIMAEHLSCHQAVAVLGQQWKGFANLANIDDDCFRREVSTGSLPAGILASLGCTDKLRALMDSRVLAKQDMAKTDGLGRTTLHRAARSGVVDSVRAVLELGGFEPQSLLQSDKMGWSALHHAAASGNADCLKTIVEIAKPEPSDFAAEDEWHRTPAHLAAAADAPEVLELIMKLDGPIDTPMGIAAYREGAVALVRQRRSEPAEREFSDIAELIGAGSARHRCEGQVDSSDAERNASPTSERWRLGRVTGFVLGEPGCEVISFRFESNASREANVEHERCIFAPTPFVLAHRLGCARASAMLQRNWEYLANRLHVSPEDVLASAREGAVPLGEVVARGASQALRNKTIQRWSFAAPDSLGRTPLHRAASSRSVTTLRTVFELGEPWSVEELTSTDLRGWTMLHHAASVGDVASISLLLTRLEETSLLSLGRGDKWYRTPAHLLVMSAMTECPPVESSDVVQALQTLNNYRLPLDSTMGPKAFTRGNVLLLRPKPATPNAALEPWILGRLQTVDVDRLIVLDECNQKRYGSQEDNPVLAPTPLELSEQLYGSKSEISKTLVSLAHTREPSVANCYVLPSRAVPASGFGEVPLPFEARPASRPLTGRPTSIGNERGTPRFRVARERASVVLPRVKSKEGVGPAIHAVAAAVARKSMRNFEGVGDLGFPTPSSIASAATAASVTKVAAVLGVASLPPVKP